MSKQRNPWNWGHPYDAPLTASDEPGPEPEPATLRITSPETGAVLTDPLYPILGDGAAPGATVELWSHDRVGEGDPNAIATADENGGFAFDGDTPATAGPAGWAVRSDGVVSSPIFVTLEETPAAPEEEPERAWTGATTHAAVDAAVPADVTLPDDWSSLTLAAKKAWLDANAV